MSNPILIETERSYYTPVETWLCEPVDSTQESINEELTKIRESCPPGSLAYIATEDRGLIVKIKTPSGKWRDI